MSPKAAGLGLPIMWLCVGLALLLPGLLMQSIARQDASHRNTQTTAIVLDGAQEEKTTSGHCKRGSCNTKYECHFDYQFTPIGSDDVITGNASDRNECDTADVAGAQRTIFYDPHDPGDNGINDPNAGSNRWLGLWMFVIPGAALSIYGLVTGAIALRRRRGRG
ncbi:DUF3592 domain-containing protein [Brevibacterium sp. 91QC2O2]|uniref:DUF3592 domain-containing protein n=1 Tax=Brevibacterium sp. 91QC2O2 TaxID=2968458 RepID=UPI00211C297F|nr:DUF3592 domain-containing protein [Brevibacterium sp. 91QC2O2]MCQ9368666.1 DUF3592 domain-containing protein [Brevibacterium sp. 91QC2O2]